MPGVFTGKIICNAQVAPNTMYMTIYLPEIAQNATCGQFVNIEVSSTTDPILRRPFSICDADPEQGTISILYMTVGRGTELMSRMEDYSNIRVVGPLGRGFDIDSDAKRHILISGGCGTAPMYFLAKSLLPKNVEVLIGGKCKENLLLVSQFKNLGIEAKLATEDGSCGEQGFVTKLLETALKDDSDAVVYACGPNAMMQAVGDITLKYNAKCQLSLENRMACGIGVCMGCVQKVRDGESWKYARVCKEGPVFSAEELIWE